MATRYIGSASPGFVEKAQAGLGQAAQTFAQQDRIIGGGEEEKTAGGALSAAAAGAGAGTMINVGWGTAIGAAVGLAGYMLT